MRCRHRSTIALVQAELASKAKLSRETNPRCFNHPHRPCIWTAWGGCGRTSLRCAGEVDYAFPQHLREGAEDGTPRISPQVAAGESDEPRTGVHRVHRGTRSADAG